MIAHFVRSLIQISAGSKTNGAYRGARGRVAGWILKSAEGEI